MFVIHEFPTDETKSVKTDRNTVDLNRFIKRFSDGRMESCAESSLLGPFRGWRNSGRLSEDIDLFRGKITSDVRTRASSTA